MAHLLEHKEWRAHRSVPFEESLTFSFQFLISGTAFRVSQKSSGGGGARRSQKLKGPLEQPPGNPILRDPAWDGLHICRLDAERIICIFPL